MDFLKKVWRNYERLMNEATIAEYTGTYIIYGMVGVGLGVAAAHWSGVWR
jgi:hypothetical protein